MPQERKLRGHESALPCGFHELQGFVGLSHGTQCRNEPQFNAWGKNGIPGRIQCLWRHALVAGGLGTAGPVRWDLARLPRSGRRRKMESPWTRVAWSP